MISIPLLKKLTRQDCIGLDWGSTELKWAKLQKTALGHSRLLFLDTLELPDDETKASIILKDYVSKGGLTGTPTALGFYDEGLHIRRLELPRMPPEDLKEAVRWQLRDIAEGSMDDYTVRYSLLEETTLPDIVRLTLLGFAIKKNIIQNQTRMLQKAGLKPFFVEPAPIALAFTVERIHPTVEKEWAGCVHIGSKRAYFLAIENGKLHFVRSLAGVTAQAIQELKENYPAKLSMEIQHALDAFSIAYHMENFKKIFLTGSGASAKELATSLSKNLGIVVETLNPFENIEQVDLFPLAQEKPYLFGVALGLAALQP